MKKIRNKINKFLAPIFFMLFRLFKIEENKIIVFNHNGKGYGDSAKYIVNELLKDKKRKYKIIWATNKPDLLPPNVKSVKFFSLKCIYEMATSKIWINNVRFKLYIKKRKNQFYIQTWHSSLRLKKVEWDVDSNISKYYKKMMINDSKMTDLMISGCEFSYQNYRNGFKYTGDIAQIGTPRCDLFFQKNKAEEIKKQIISKYKLDASKKIILYAPTFRKDINYTNGYMDLDYVYKKLSANYNLLVRLHPNKEMGLNLSNNNFVDVTKYDDMQELLCASDILITDYSGCCFDMMIANKPCILLLKDLDNYISNDRNLYFKIEDLPFKKVYSDVELVSIIKNKGYLENESSINSFKKQVGLYEFGNASKKLKSIIDKIIDGDYNGEKI